MRTWGLTGGIASGKSTVAKAFGQLGVPSVDADALYHGLVAPLPDGSPSALTQAIGSQFPGCIAAQGRLDRAKLAAHVFADPAARARLEAITHPAVQAAAAAQMEALAARGVAHALYDVPLLFECNLAHKFAGVVLVWVPEDLQLQRLCARDKLSLIDARARLSAQWPLESKRKHATWVVDNSGSQAQTQAQVAQVASAMLSADVPLGGSKRP